MKTYKRYKFLRLSGKTIKSGRGNLKWKVGEWQTIDGDLDLCHNGLHCSKKVYEAFSYVQGEVLAEVEVRGKKVVTNDKEAWTEMRIVKAYKWQKKDSVALSIYAAEHVIDDYEKMYPNDDRPRNAIEAARKVLEKDTPTNRKKAEAAESAAESAARSAAWSAAWSAESAARSAAWSAESAAWSAESAAWSAAWSAESAAWSAAWSAAESAARSAAESAAWSALVKKIDKWMTNRIEELENV